MTAELPMEVDSEDEGRWLAQVVHLPGALSYRDREDDARRQVTALCLHVLIVPSVASSTNPPSPSHVTA